LSPAHCTITRVRGSHPDFRDLVIFKMKTKRRDLASPCALAPELHTGVGVAILQIDESPNKKCIGIPTQADLVYILLYSS
jgi:hypothetical protein